VQIADNATEPATNVNDDPQTFVCQHYHDFLNREPDPSGLNFWKNEITSCGADAACIEVKRTMFRLPFTFQLSFNKLAI